MHHPQLGKLSIRPEYPPALTAKIEAYHRELDGIAALVAEEVTDSRLQAAAGSSPSPAQRQALEGIDARRKDRQRAVWQHELAARKLCAEAAPMMLAIRDALPADASNYGDVSRAFATLANYGSAEDVARVEAQLKAIPVTRTIEVMNEYGIARKTVPV